MIFYGSKYNKYYHSRKGQKCYKRYYNNLKIDILNHYGKICQHCGFSDKKALQIDHIKGKGNKHRKLLGGRGFYVWLRKNNYPKGFQVLCANCNWIKKYDRNEVR